LAVAGDQRQTNIPKTDDPDCGCPILKLVLESWLHWFVSAAAGAAKWFVLNSGIVSSGAGVRQCAYI
jgi:hypothetical protein